MKTLCRLSADAEIVQLDQNDEISALIDLLELISAELGWRPGCQLRDFQSQALHLAASVGHQIAGGMQVVSSNNVRLLPYCRVWPELAEPQSVGIAHVTILALKKAYRAKHGLFWPLCVELWRYCVTNNISLIRLEATRATMALYCRLGFPLTIIGELRLHWGEDCYLCQASVEHIAATIAAKAERSQTYHDLLASALRC